jgi:hypothetical protein
MRVRENRPHYLMSIKITGDLVSYAASAELQLIHLLGSVEHDSDKNFDSETEGRPLVGRRPYQLWARPRAIHHF